MVVYIVILEKSVLRVAAVDLEDRRAVGGSW